MLPFILFYNYLWSVKHNMSRIIIAVIVSILTGIVIEYDFDLPNISTIFVVIIMGAFLMNEIRKNKS